MNVYRGPYFSTLVGITGGLVAALLGLLASIPFADSGWASLPDTLHLVLFGISVAILLLLHFDRVLGSILTQAIGASDLVVPTITMVKVHLGDCFLLATDGICKTLPNSEMLSLMLTTSTPEQACQLLVTAASDAGRTDNATCVVVEID